jgi:hypothetical protein
MIQASKTREYKCAEPAISSLYNFHWFRGIV